MYEYVKDKEFLKASHSMCANLVNQLVQELKKYDIDASMSNDIPINELFDNIMLAG